MTPEQCTGARRLLKWSQEDLSLKSGISITTINRFEKRAIGYSIKTSTLSRLRQTIETGGVEFVGAGALPDQFTPAVEIKFADGSVARLRERPKLGIV